MPMRIAVLLSGQPRFLERCYPYIYEFILRPNGMPDVFAHLWWSTDSCDTPYKFGGDGGWKHQRISTTAPETFHKLYEPLRVCIEPPKIWKFTAPNPAAMSEKVAEAASEEDPSFERIFSNNISMFHSMYRANELKKAYEQEHGFRYDWVIRLRTDLEIYTPVICRDLHPNRFYFSDIGQKQEFVCDWLNVANSAQMDVATRVWADFEELFAKHYGKESTEKFSNEHILRHQLVDAGIQAESVKWRVTLPRF